MPFYYGKRFESARTGARIVGVECDKCGCVYFYELARVGTGAASAPYGIGASAAARSSQKQSERDLQTRLEHEAELVPCPKCNWINEELVEGYRLGRCRRVGTLALGVAVIGTTGSLIGAWFISIGPAVDRGAIPYFLFAGPAIFASLAVIMTLLRKWARSRIRPNRDFPLAPHLPPGSPPALVMNEDNSELRIATPRHDEYGTATQWYDFQIGRDRLPPSCCECLNCATMEYAYKQPVGPGLLLEIPRCADCARRSTRQRRRLWWTCAAISFAAGSGVLLAISLDSIVFWAMLGAHAIVSLAFASYIASWMTAPVKWRVADKSRGVLRLRFRNPQYHLSLIQQEVAEGRDLPKR